MPRIPHSILLKAYKRVPLLPLILRGSRTLPSAINELRWLVEHVQDTSSRGGSKLQMQKLLQLCKRRSTGEPLQYILGSQPFGDLDIKCRPGVLIPRPETEAYTSYLAQLIISRRLERVLSGNFCSGDDPHKFLPASRSRMRSLKILDLCTGSGCIPLLLSRLLSSYVSHLEIYGWDISKQAVNLAIDNLVHNDELLRVVSGRHNRTSFGLVDIFDQDEKLKNFLTMQSDQTREMAEVDIIISNPPYISQQAFRKETTRSVRNWEPKLALVPAAQRHLRHMLGRVDAADVFYDRLIALHNNVFRSLVLVMEVGDEAQALRVAKMALEYGILGSSQSTKTNHVEIWRDSPETNIVDEHIIGGDKVLFRGSGQARAIVLFKFRHVGN